MADEMVVLSRTFDLLAWLVPHSERFPRAYRGSVTQRLLDAALDLQGRLFDAQSRRGARRAEALTEADAALGRLRLYLRLAHHWHWINDGQYRHVSLMVAEIGRLPQPGRAWQRGAGSGRIMWGAQHTRKPLLSLRLSGWLSLRAAQRQLSRLLFHDPPRSTRGALQTAPPAEAGPLSKGAGRPESKGEGVRKKSRRAARAVR